MPFPKYFLLLLLPAWCSCKSHPQRRHQHSFYYWKTTFAELDTVSERQIKKFGIDHFYIKYMDIDWSEKLSEPIPAGKLIHWGSELYTCKAYTPVIFVTNRTFEHISDAGIDTLAVKVTKKIAEITQDIEKDAVRYAVTIYPDQNYAAHNPALLQKTIIASGKNCTELQIDCDWTTGTKDKYFSFLKKMKILNPGKNLSATIRLYPYKYRKKMGIPPVDEGMLMCYNLGGINDAATNNSIFDIDEMEKYLNVEKYPLPLDIALPVFRWEVWFRGSKLEGILHNFIIPDMGGHAFTRINDTHFRVNTDTVIDNDYFREGDDLRMEAPNDAQLLKAADMLSDKLPNYRRLAFFDWNKQAIDKYEQTIQKIFDSH